MNIGLDISPLQKGHSVRGVGYYVQTLHKYLQADKDIECVAFKSFSELPEVDLVHIPYFDPFFTHLPIINSHKMVVTVHDLIPFVLSEQFPIGVKGNLRWKLNKFLLSKVDRIITDSEASKNDIKSQIRFPEERIHPVHLAAGEEFKQLLLSQQESNRIRKKYSLPEKFALYVGDVTANKNLPRLIDAVKRINISLVLVGKAIISRDYDVTNPWNRDLVYIQNKMKNDHRFIQLGFVETEDLVKLYNIADLFVFPSLYEGFGLPVLEAMQSGCPVVTSHGGSLKEVAGDAAYIIDPLDTTNIVDGIQKAFFSNDMRKQLIQKGLKNAQKFTWDKTIKETKKVYEEVVKSNT